MGLQTNIYDGKDFYFTLQFRDNETLILEPKSNIQEPMNWSNMVNNIPRSKEYFGFWTDFIEDKYGLTFTFAQNGGGQILKDIYDEFGDQAEVYFTIGANGKQIKSWRVNLQEYELSQGSDISPFGGVLSSIEKMPFQGKLKARMNTPCTINEQFTMDGALLTPIPVYTLRLHSKTLQQEALAQTTTPQSPASFDNVNSGSTPFQHDPIIQPDQSNVQVSELSQVFTQPTGILQSWIDDGTSLDSPKAPNVGGLGFTSISPSLYLSGINQYTPSTNGQLTISWSGQSIIYTSGQIAAFGRPYWDIAPRVVQMRNINGKWVQINVLSGTIKTISNSAGGLMPPPVGVTATFPYDLNGASQQYILPNMVIQSGHSIADLRSSSSGVGICTRYDDYSWSESFTLVVEANDQIFVHLVMLQANSDNFSTDLSNVNCGLQFDQFINTIQYTQLTTTPGSTSDGYRAIDILNQMVENITGQKNAVKSSFFSQGGAGWKFLYTNGYAIRNFSSLFHQPKKSLQGFLGDLQVMRCIGGGIREIDNVENLILEYITDFFKTREIARFGDTLNCKDKHSTLFSYNKFKFGYNTWQGLNLVMEDEYNTQGYYLTEFLKYGDSSFSKMSDTIASGYILEEQRRNQFLLNPSQSITNDEDWFVVATSEPSIFIGIYLIGGYDPINNIPPYFSFSISSLALLKGDSVSFDIYTFYIDSEVPTYPIIGEDRYFVVNLGNWIAGTYKISDIVFDTSTHRWYASKSNFTSSTAPHSDSTNWKDVATVLGNKDITITPSSPNQVFAERNQPFAICSGVIDPSTIYNGRLSLKHILYNWSPIISIGLYFTKSDNLSKIQTRLVKMNSKFTTQFLPTEEFKGNAGDLILNEFNNEPISNFKNFLFSPKEMDCDIRGGWNEIEVIRKALCGETGNDLIDFGGLTLRDNAGDFWFCHVNTLRYDLVKEMINLNVQKVFKLT